MKTHWISTTLFCLAVAVLASTADAALVSVDFNAVDPDGTMNRDNTFGVFADDDPTYVWNQRFDPSGVSTGALFDTDGNVTGISATATYSGAAQNWAPNDGVLNDGYHDNNTNSLALTISGLTTNTTYELVVFDSTSHPTETQTVGGAPSTAFPLEVPSSPNYDDANVLGGNNTYEYWNVSTGAGTTLSWLGSGTSFDTLTGFQIRELAAATAIPEPSTFILAAVGLLSLGMTRRRRRR